MKTVLVINLEVKDNHEEAAIGARLALDLCQEVSLSSLMLCNFSITFLPVLLIKNSMNNCYVQIEATESWEDSIDDVLSGFEKQHRRKLLYSISYY